MNAHATAVTAHPAAVIFVIIASPLDTFSTVWPSVICMQHGGAMRGGLLGKAMMPRQVLLKRDLLHV